MQDPIGRRSLRLGTDREVIVEIGRPYPWEYGNGDFKCEYEISGLGNGKASYAIGVDGIQALYLALQSIGTDLYTSEESNRGDLRWEGGMIAGDLGFPVPDAISDLRPMGRET